MGAATRMDERDWGLLVLLSILWGGSFFFNAVAVGELPPLTIVLGRVTIAAALLLPLTWARGERLPASPSGWMPFLVMGLLNNVIPFSLIVAGQTRIASGIASVLNATTPLVTVPVMAAAGDEPLAAREIAGACIIGGALVLVDGRIGRWLPIREARARSRPGAQPPPAPGGRGERGHIRP